MAFAKVGKSGWFGVNNKKSHPDIVKKFQSGAEGSCQHAELDAIIKIPRDARHKTKLYVMRFSKLGEVTMAKPCELCQKFISKAGVKFKNVFYTNWDGDWDCLS